MPPRILVLEPDPMRQVFFRAALSSAGHQSQAVAAAAEAADLLRAERFRLVLLGPLVDSAVAADLRQAEEVPPIIKLALLPDCVIGEQLPGGSNQVLRELPAILEALTRYLRFAPPVERGSERADEELLQDWAEFERRSGE
jgi:hypothetical protein